MKYKSGKEEWNLDSEQVQSAPIIDPNVGQERVIRTFVLHKKPGIEATKEDVLRSTLRLIKENVSRDGWTFDETPKIDAMKDGWGIRVILRPAMRNGVVGFVENEKPRTAHELLGKANKDLQKIQEAKKHLQ